MDTAKARADSVVPQIAMVLYLLLWFTMAITPNIHPTTPNKPPKQMDVNKEKTPIHNERMEKAVATDDGWVTVAGLVAGTGFVVGCTAGDSFVVGVVCTVGNIWGVRTVCTAVKLVCGDATVTGWTLTGCEVCCGTEETGAEGCNGCSSTSLVMLIPLVV